VINDLYVDGTIDHQYPSKCYREALAKVREAEAAGARNANETYLIERMRLAAASGAGDAETAARSYDALSGSGRITGPDSCA
jgi:hypothetical protein